MFNRTNGATLINLSARSRKTELLDEAGISAKDLHQNLAELETINALLGGHKATFKGLRKIVEKEGKSLKIIDLGCGGGDTLRAIAKWAKKRNIQVGLTGVDILPEAINYAKEKSKGFNINYIVANFNEVETLQYDVAISSLFCHHLYDEALINLIKTKLRLAKWAIINDLHRHFLAYYSIKWLTHFFSKSHLVKHDACLSVARSFRRQDLLLLLKQQNIQGKVVQIDWVWAFRWMVLLKRNEA